MAKLKVGILISGRGSNMAALIKAAEAGLTGNPGAYRDYVLQPYAYRLESPSAASKD